MRCKHARLSHGPAILNRLLANLTLTMLAAILLSALLVLVPLAVVLGTCWHDSATRCHELIGYAAAVLAGLSLTGAPSSQLSPLAPTQLGLSGVYTGLAIGWLAAGILLPAPAHLVVAFAGSCLSCLFGFAVGRGLQVCPATHAQARGLRWCDRALQ